MLFNLYGNHLEKISLPNIISTLKKFHMTKYDLSFVDVLKSYQSRAGEEIYNDGNGWSHEIIYVGY
jgi:hypothetical protein